VDGSGTLTALEGGYTVLPQLELSIALNGFASLYNATPGYSAKAKFQFLGGDRSKKDPGLSAAISTSYLLLTGRASGDQKTSLGPGGYGWKAELEGKNLASAVTIGYRINNNFLFFTGVGQSQISTKLILNQDANTSSEPDAGGSYSITDSGRANNFGLGIDMGSQTTSLQISAQRYWYEWSELKNQADALTAKIILDF